MFHVLINLCIYLKFAEPFHDLVSGREGVKLVQSAEKAMSCDVLLCQSFFEIYFMVLVRRVSASTVACLSNVFRC